MIWLADMNIVATLISFLAQGFHVVDLIGFRCAVGGCHRFAAQSTSRGDGDEVAVTLLLEDVVEFVDDKRPARDVGVDGRKLHGVVQCGIDVPRTRADDGEVNIFQFGTEGFDGSCYFVLLGNVSRGGGRPTIPMQLPSAAYFSKSALPMPEVAPMIIIVCCFILSCSLFQKLLLLLSCSKRYGMNAYVLSCFPILTIMRFL